MWGNQNPSTLICTDVTYLGHWDIPPASFFRIPQITNSEKLSKEKGLFWWWDLHAVALGKTKLFELIISNKNSEMMYGLVSFFKKSTIYFPEKIFQSSTPNFTFNKILNLKIIWGMSYTSFWEFLDLSTLLGLLRFSQI